MTEPHNYCCHCGSANYDDTPSLFCSDECREEATCDVASPTPSQTAVIVHNGLQYHVEPGTFWCRVYDPSNEGCWADKGPAAELLPAPLRWLIGEEAR